MKYLILLNRKFPYKSGEAFLENEIDEISEHFDKILIFPSDVSIGSKATRNIKSKNVEVKIVEDKDYKTRKYKYLLKSVFGKKFNNNKLNFRDDIEERFFYEGVKEQSNAVIDNLKKIDFNKEDEIFIYSYWLYINAGVAIEISKYLKNKGLPCSVISRAHRFDIYEEERYLPAREYLLKNLDVIYACSDNGADYLKNRYGNYKEKIKTSYLGTYDHGIGTYSKDGVFRIVSCSRLSNVKRVHLIVEALALMDDKEKIEWTHIGGGELLEKVKKLAEEKLTGKVNFKFLGAIPNKEVYEYYLNNPVDLFINVSSSEGLPVSIMEAISFGIPVIATDVGGTGEIVIDNVTGILLKKNPKTEEIFKNICDIHKMKNIMYLSLRKSTRELWKERYMAKVNYKKFINDIL